MAPQLIVVTGAPATGKTTIAEELADRLGVPIISKDTLKEALYETIGSGGDVEDAIERAALAILFSVVDSQLAAGVSVIAESNFDSSSDLAPFRELCGRRELELVQIHVRRDSEELLRAFAERAEGDKRHPGHGDEPEDVDEVRMRLERGDWDALDLPGETIEHDTSGGDQRVDDLVERLRSGGS